jgi:hypothetical protein
VTCDRSVVLSEYSVSSTNKTDRHDITEILLKVTLNTINQTKPEPINMIIGILFQIVLKLDERELEYALQDKILVSSIMQDGLPS